MEYRKDDTGCPCAALSCAENGFDVKRLLCTVEEHAEWRETRICALCTAIERRAEK